MPLSVLRIDDEPSPASMMLLRMLLRRKRYNNMPEPANASITPPFPSPQPGSKPDPEPEPGSDPDVVPPTGPEPDPDVVPQPPPEPMRM
jgi:hypothetical protein